MLLRISDFLTRFTGGYRLFLAASCVDAFVYLLRVFIRATAAFLVVCCCKNPFVLINF